MRGEVVPQKAEQALLGRIPLAHRRSGQKTSSGERFGHAARLTLRTLSMATGDAQSRRILLPLASVASVASTSFSLTRELARRGTQQLRSAPQAAAAPRPVRNGSSEAVGGAPPKRVRLLPERQAAKLRGSRRCPPLALAKPRHLDLS